MVDQDNVGPIREKEARFHRSTIRFEEGDSTIWILAINTPPAQRQKGQAKALITFLRKKGKKIIPGTFLPDGKRYLTHYFTPSEIAS